MSSSKIPRPGPRAALRLAAAFAVPCAVAALPAQTVQQTVIPVHATAATNPPALTFTWPADPTATGYTVVRRNAGAAAWGPATTIPGGGAATTWTDPGVATGARYEYWFRKTGNPAGHGFLTAGVEAAPIEDRGRIVLLVDATQATALGSRLERLIDDLVGDGWSVLRHDVLPTEAVPAVKARITAAVAAHPAEVKAVFLLGRIPVPYSGNIAPDGHPDHRGAWAADVFYGEIDGVWTDTAVNTTTAQRPENRNVPGDGKFDQSSLPSDVDLAVGRVDLANMPAFQAAEVALLSQYLDKDHDWRHKVFTVAERAVIDDNFGYFSGEAFAASGWRNFAALVGAANVVAGDYFATLNAPGDGHLWSYGCGGGSYTSAGGIGTTTDFTTSHCRTVFTMLFGSYFGDWDSTDNFLRAPLCSGLTLANAWAGRPHWSFHAMGLGETIGHCARYSQNDTSAGGFGARSVHIALMGDPTLRQHVIAPPSGVAVVDQWPQVLVSWTPSADPVAGYHVYRAAAPRGPFTRLSANALAGTSFVDPMARSGPATYMVRALQLETTPGGSYWNLSQGAFATLSPQAASHTSYGAGCYAISDSFYQPFASPALASAALSGTSITLTPDRGGYTVGSGGGSYRAPGGAALVLPLGDDDQTAITPSQPVPHPGGAAATLHVHSNGIVGIAPLSLTAPASAMPEPARLLAEATTAWYCWHDFDPTEPGSGQVLVEEASGTLFVTWHGVESRPRGVANASTMQLQFEFATGVVRYVWPSLSTVGDAPWLIGFSPGGPSTDAGPVDLATMLPLSVGSANVEPLRLSAAPPPIVTPGAGVVVTYTIDHAPEWAPGQRAGFVILGLRPDPAGAPLASIGMPGCAQYLGSLDLFLFFAGSGSAQTVALPLPAGVPASAMVFAQAIALVPPHSLPNGQNPFGAVTSNGIRSLILDR